MKIFYFSTVCSEKTFEDIVYNSKEKPSASAQTFEMGLLSGFDCRENVTVDIYSFVPIPAFPKGYKLIWKKKVEKITETLKTKIIPCLNVQIVKQICYKIFSKYYLKKWLIENNEDDKCVLLYSLYPPVAKNVLKLCKKFNCKCCVFIADLPALQFTNTKPKGIKKILASHFRNNAIKLQNEFDGYIFFSRHMSELIGNKKDYIVIEGVCNKELFNEVEIIPKSVNKSIMYAGMLYKKYGIDVLVEAFLKLKGDYELWLFGDGDYVEQIIKSAEKDSRIKFFGRRSHKEILKYERAAHLLVNVRKSDNEYTKYSFPSKTIEYMLSGTPMLTTKLPGIPKEYFDYLFVVDEDDVERIKYKFEEILGMDEEKLKAFGKKAQEFVMNSKNGKEQVKKIINFIEFMGRKDKKQ